MTAATTLSGDNDDIFPGLWKNACRSLTLCVCIFHFTLFLLVANDVFSLLVFNPFNSVCVCRRGSEAENNFFSSILGPGQQWFIFVFWRCIFFFVVSCIGKEVEVVFGSK